MAERERVVRISHHAAQRTFLDRRVACLQHRLDQPRLGVSGNGGHELRDPASFGREACDARYHGIANRAGYLPGRRGEEFRQVEGIAAGRGIQAGSRAPECLRELGYRRLRQCCQRQPFHGLTRQKSDRNLQRMPRVNLIGAVGGDQQRARAADAAAEILHEVEGGVICPMHVFHDQHDRLAGTLEHIDRSCENPLAVGALRHRLEQRTAHLATDIGERPERLRRGQRIARAPQHAYGIATPAYELADHRGLADAGLAGDQHHATFAGRAYLVPACQLCELLIAFEQQHRDCLVTWMSSVFLRRWLLWVRYSQKIGRCTDVGRWRAP